MFPIGMVCFFSVRTNIYEQNNDDTKHAVQNKDIDMKLVSVMVLRLKF